MPVVIRTDYMLAICEICDRAYRFPMCNNGLGFHCDPSPLTVGWKWLPVPLNPEPNAPRPPLEMKLACPACVAKRTLVKPKRFSIPYTPVTNAYSGRNDQ